MLKYNEEIGSYGGEGPNKDNSAFDFHIPSWSYHDALYGKDCIIEENQ